MVKIQVDSQGKAYVTSDNKVLVANNGITPSGTMNITQNGIYDVTEYASANIEVPGSSALLSTLTVTPSQTAQTISPTGGIDGWDTVNVSAVTSSIDNNIISSNIKKNVVILGCTGSLESSGFTEIPSYEYSNNPSTGDKIIDTRTYSLTGSEFSGVKIITAHALQHVFEERQITGIVDFSNVEEMGPYALNYAFAECGGITGSVTFSKLDYNPNGTIPDFAFEYAFVRTGITSASFPILKNIAYRMFYSAFLGSSLTSLDLSAVVTMDSNAMYRACYECQNLTSVDFSSLETISTNSLTDAFRYCTSLTSIRFPKLTTISNGGSSTAFSSPFAYTTNLTDIYFDALTTNSLYTRIFQNMLSNTGTDVMHTVHFPSNLESAVQGLSQYPNFGGVSGYVTIAFDLPATS